MMLQNMSKLRSGGRSALLLCLSVLLVAACGLGMDTQARLDRGHQAFSEGEYRAAVIDAKNILLEEPDNLAARLLLGRSSVEIGDGVSAEKEFRRALELGAAHHDVIVDLGRAFLLQNKFDDVIAEMLPESADDDANRLAVMRMRGDALVGLQQPVSAREIYLQVLAFDEDDIAAQLGVVHSYVVEKNYMQARATLNHVLTLDDTYIPAWLTSGSLNTRVRDPRKAASDYERAVNLAKENADVGAEVAALSGLADALLAQSKLDEARPVLVRMSEIAADDIRTLLVSARLASADADWNKAQAELQEILRRAPKFRQAQMLLGFVHKESGNLREAEMYLSAVVAAAPSNPNARRLLAEIRLELNKAEEARQVLAPLLTQATADVALLSMAAGASLSLGEFDDAAALLERGVAADPDNVNLLIQLAFAYFRSGEADKAQKILEAIPAETVGDNEFRRDSLLILTQMAQGLRAEALENAKELLSRWPSRSDAHSLVGSIEMSTGVYASARESFEAASRLAPDDTQSIRYLARLDELDGDSDSATNRYLLILELEPSDIRAMVSLARLAARGEDHIKAREWLEKARETDEAAVAPRTLLGSLHLAFGNFPEAESVVREALELEPENPKLHSMMGHAQLNQENFRDAEFSFGRALELEPEEPSHRLNLARAQSTKGNKASAIVTLQDSMDITMRHIPSAVLLASLKVDAGDLDGAAGIARQLLEHYPNESVPQALDAELKVRAGKLIEASAAYDKVLRIANTQRHAVRSYQIRNQAGLDNEVESLLNYLEERPLDSNTRIYLAQAYQGQQEVGKANTQYERVLADEPDNFIAANNLAWNYFQSGDSRAADVARRAYAVQPDNSAVADTLGWILVKKDSLEEGIAILRDAADLGDGRPDIRFHLAAGLSANGQTTEAKTILQEILATEDEFSNRQAAESLLKTL